MSQYLMLVVLLSTVVAETVDHAKRKIQIGIKKRMENCIIKTKKGDLLHIRYRGLLENGDEFDNSYENANPFTFVLGSGQVIKGWDQGLMGMCVGEHRKLIIPSQLAYGKAGVPPKIPSNANLRFHVELVKIEFRNDF